MLIEQIYEKNEYYQAYVTLLNYDTPTSLSWVQQHFKDHKILSDKINQKFSKTQILISSWFKINASKKLASFDDYFALELFEVYKDEKEEFQSFKCL